MKSDNDRRIQAISNIHKHTGTETHTHIVIIACVLISLFYTNRMLSKLEPLQTERTFCVKRVLQLYAVYDNDSLD